MISELEEGIIKQDFAVFFLEGDQFGLIIDILFSYTVEEGKCLKMGFNEVLSFVRVCLTVDEGLTGMAKDKAAKV